MRKRGPTKGLGSDEASNDSYFFGIHDRQYSNNADGRRHILKTTYTQILETT